MFKKYLKLDIRCWNTKFVMGIWGGKHDKGPGCHLSGVHAGKIVQKQHLCSGGRDAEQVSISNTSLWSTSTNCIHSSNTQVFLKCTNPLGWLLMSGTSYRCPSDVYNVSGISVDVVYLGEKSHCWWMKCFPHWRIQWLTKSDSHCMVQEVVNKWHIIT